MEVEPEAMTDLTDVTENGSEGWSSYLMIAQRLVDAENVRESAVQNKGDQNQEQER